MATRDPMPVQVAQQHPAADEPLSVHADRVRAELLERTPALSGVEALHPIARFIELLDRQDPFLGYRHLSGSVVEWFDSVVARLGSSAAPDYLQLVLVCLIEQFDTRFERSGLDDAFRAEFELSFRRILGGAVALDPAVRQHLYSDLYLKDLGIARQTLIPCVSHVVYRHSGIPRRALLKPRRPAELVRALACVLGKARGFRPFLENHVHPAMLDRFTAAGRQQCFELVRRLFDTWPDARGLIGTSWYYDPAVGRISPRLAYLHDGPAQGGACFIDMGPHPDATVGALARSPTRTRLHREGLYQPRNYLMVWTRGDMLGCAGHLRESK